MKYFYEFNPRLGSDVEERNFSSSVSELKRANSEQLVQFFHIILNNLSTLLIRPSVSEESAKVSNNAFEAMANIVQRVQSLDLPRDKHDRNIILSSYLQYVFNAPQGIHSAGSFDAKSATLTKGRTSSMGSSEEEYMSVASKFKGGSVRGSKGVSFNSECLNMYTAHWITDDILFVCLLAGGDEYKTSPPKGAAQFVKKVHGFLQKW